MSPRGKRDAGEKLSKPLQANRDLARRIETAGRRRARALDEAGQQLELIVELCRRARAEGANVKELAELAGVSRKHLHSLLGE
jgi:hypothetical protein